MLDEEEEQLMVEWFDDGCKDVVVVERKRRGQSSGFVEEQDGRAKQEAAPHEVMVPSHVDRQERSTLRKQV